MTELEKVIAAIHYCTKGYADPGEDECNPGKCPYAAYQDSYDEDCEEMLLKDALALLKQMSRWIPIKSRPMDEEERKEWTERLGFVLTDEESVIYTSELPDDGDEVMTCNLYGTVDVDIFRNDGDGVYFENNGDMDGIVAWMPKPKPYKPPKEDSDAEVH